MGPPHRSQGLLLVAQRVQENQSHHRVPALSSAPIQSDSTQISARRREQGTNDVPEPDKACRSAPNVSAQNFLGYSTHKVSRALRRGMPHPRTGRWSAQKLLRGGGKSRSSQKQSRCMLAQPSLANSIGNTNLCLLLLEQLTSSNLLYQSCIRQLDGKLSSLGFSMQRKELDSSL